MSKLTVDEANEVIEWIVAQELNLTMDVFEIVVVEQSDPMDISHLPEGVQDLVVKSFEQAGYETDEILQFEQ